MAIKSYPQKYPLREVMKLAQFLFILCLLMIGSALDTSRDKFPDINYMVESLNNNVDKSNQALHCTKLVVMDNNSNNSMTNLRNANTFMPQYKEEQTPAFLSTDLSDNRLGDMVSQEVGCLTTLLETDSFDVKHLASMTMKMGQHNIFKIGGRKPNSTELKLSDRPLVWIVSVDSQGLAGKQTLDKYHIYMHCPKENQFYGHKMPLTLVHRPEIPSSSWRITCPSRLTGQNLTLGYVARSKLVNVDGISHTAGINGYLFLYLAEMFKFSPTLKQMNLHIRGTWKRYYRNINQGKLIGMGQFISQYSSVEVLKPHVYRHYYFVTRSPREVATYTSIFKPFSSDVWVSISLTLLFLLIMFYTTHSLYSSDYIAHENLHKSKSSLVNFAISVYFKMTEPEAIDWFTDRWSTGRWLTFLWRFLCFFILAFYNCNLRAHLAAISYEDPINTNQDVVDNGKRVWIMTELRGNFRAQLEKQNATHLPIYPVAVLADEQNSSYSFSRSKGFPISSLKDMLVNGSVALLEKNYVRQTLRLSPKYKDVLKEKTLYVSKESVYYTAGSYIAKKYNPAREELNIGMLWAQECGLIFKWSHQGLPAEALMEPRLPLIRETARMRVEQLILPLAIYLIILITAAMQFAKEIVAGTFVLRHRRKIHFA